MVRSGESFLESVGIVADKLGAAIDDHLRGVNLGDSEAAGVFLLALSESSGREAIVPAETIPIVDVLAENDDRTAVECALFFE